ncbi:phage tail protein, partial [Acinetobacter baumannii]
AEIGPIKQDIQNTKDRIAQEVIDRQNAIQQAKDGLSQQIIDGDEGVLEVVNTVKQSSDEGIAAAQESIRVVANDLSLVAEKTDGVYAQLNPPLIGSESDLIGNDQGFAGTWSVQSAMIEGDLALSKRIDTTAVELNNLQAYAQREVQARIEGDRVTVQKIDNYIASNDSALATVRESAQVAVEQSSANAEAIELINLELDDKASTGQLTQVKSDIKNVDDKVAAQTVRIDGVYAQINPPLIGSESDLIGNEGGYAGVWSEQSARIEGDLAQSKRTDQVSAQLNDSNALFQQQINANASAISSTIKVTETLQTKVGENSASIQNVSESVDGIYAQQFTKFDVNGHVSGHGSMNDGTTSTFIFNYDAIQFGTPVGVDGVEPKPLMTLQNTPVTLPNGTVIPRGLFIDNASIGYITADKIYATSLSAISADLGDIEVDNAHIKNGAVDTLKIQDEAVTVPSGVINQSERKFYFAVSNSMAGSVAYTQDLITLNVETQGGKLRIDGSFVFDCKVRLTQYPSSYNILKCVTLACRVLVNGTVAYTQEIYPTFYEGSNTIRFIGVTATPVYILPASTGTKTVVLQLAYITKYSNIYYGSFEAQGGFAEAPTIITMSSLSTLELKK